MLDSFAVFVSLVFNFLYGLMMISTSSDSSERASIIMGFSVVVLGSIK